MKSLIGIVRGMPDIGDMVCGGEKVARAASIPPDGRNESDMAMYCSVRILLVWALSYCYCGRELRVL